MLWNVTITLNESSEWHAHDVYEFVFCQESTGILAMERQHIGLVNRRTILIPPKARHRYVFSANESANLKIVCLTPIDSAVYLSPVQLSVLKKTNQTGATFADHSERWPRLQELTELIPDGLAYHNRGRLHVAWGAISLLLARHMCGQQLSENRQVSRHLSNIQKVCDWLDEHLEHTGGLDEIAARFGLSRSLLTREFRHHAGTSVVNYINTRRLQRVASLLASTDKNITEAAFESGFPGLANFYRRFKILYGVTPVKFRKMIEGRHQAPGERSARVSRSKDAPPLR